MKNKETLEEAAERAYNCGLFSTKTAFIAGTKWQQERMFDLMNHYVDDVMGGCNLRAKEWFEQFKNK